MGVKERIRKKEKRSLSKSEIQTILNSNGFFIGEGPALHVRPWMVIVRGKYTQKHELIRALEKEGRKVSDFGLATLREEELTQSKEVVLLATATTNELTRLLVGDKFKKLRVADKLTCSTDEVNEGIKIVGCELCRPEDAFYARMQYLENPEADNFVGKRVRITTEPFIYGLDNRQCFFMLGSTVIGGTSNLEHWMQTMPTKADGDWGPNEVWTYVVPTEIILEYYSL